MAVLCKIAEKLYVGFSVELHFMHSQTTNEIFFICQFNSELGTYI